MLFVILLFSCDENNNVCIDADDFGDVERETIRVYAKDDPTLDKCSIGDVSNASNNYSGLETGKPLITCLTQDFTIKNNPDSESVIEIKKYTNTLSEVYGCLKYNKLGSERALMLCEAFCEYKCSQKHIYKSSTEEFTSNEYSTDGSKKIFSNTPRPANLDIGVNITPGSQIFISAKGNVTTVSGGNSRTEGIGSTGSEITPTSRILSSPAPQDKIIIDSQNPYNFKLKGNIFDSTTRFSFDTATPTSSLTTSAQVKNQSIQTRIFARRNLIILNQYPDGYEANRTPIKANPDAWKCLARFPNQSKSIDCSIHANANYDQYYSQATPFENEYSSQVFDVGTESLKIIKDGGFIRYNNDLITPEISDDSTVSDYQGVIYNKIIISPSDSSLTPIASSGQDRFIDLKTDCTSLTISLSIVKKDDATKIYFTTTNLKLSTAYTTKNIPFYSDSVIKINIDPATPARTSSCNLFIKAQKYLDIIIPNSGFLDFKIKDLEEISYDDLDNKGVYNPILTSNNKNLICNAGKFATTARFKRVSGQIGITLICSDGDPMRPTVNPDGGYYIGYNGSAGYVDHDYSNGFSKIKIIKNSAGIQDVIFYNFGATTSSNTTADAGCRGNGNCVEISCNGGKISGLKAQANSTTIQALSVICLGNNSSATSSAQNICPLYARIINSDGEKTLITDNDSLSLAKIFSQSSAYGLPSLTNKKIDGIYYGLQGYASPNKNKLTDPECKIPLDIVGCEIDGSSCVNTNFSTSMQNAFNVISECASGDGIDGQKQTNKAGTGGGGGGNNSKATRIPSAYEANGSAQAGKNGESYINPEFDFGYINYSSSLYGRGAPSGSSNPGQDGIIKLFDSSNPFPFLSFSYSNSYSANQMIPRSISKLRYQIVGGGGGAGGNCGSGVGGDGANGDYIEGILDFSKYRTTTSNLFLIGKIGAGGSSGLGCSSSTPSRGINRDSLGNLKGGQGAFLSANSGASGAGGSASYIALIRNDEVGDTSRIDFLVIAGGGGGGGGAYSSGGTVISGSNSSNAPYKRSEKLNSNIFGYRLGISFSDLDSSTPSDYYEYDDFFSKNSSTTRNSSTSIDPSRRIIVNDKDYPNSPEVLFVRKNQILRILPKSFEKLWNSKEGPKECGVGMIMRITPRPAALCLRGIDETIINFNCVPDVAGQIASLSSGGSTVSAPADPVIQGCRMVTDCNNPSSLNYFCPIKTANCLNINCSGAGDVDSAKSGCVFQGAITSCPVSDCAGSDLLSAYQQLNGSAFDCSQTQTKCEACRQKRMQEILESPKINISGNDAYKCYNFESYGKSVNKFLTNYNALATSALKNDLISSETDIKVISDYDENYGFGNYENHNPVDQFGYLSLKNNIRFNNVGEISELILTNGDFRTFATDISGSILPLVKKTGLTGTDSFVANLRLARSLESVSNDSEFSNGQKLIVSLCKESDKNGVLCKMEQGITTTATSEISNPLSLGLYTGNATGDKFAFDAKGILRRTSIDAVGTAINCDNASPNENFICFKNDLGNAGEIEKYRLSFSIDSGNQNENGFYDVRIEKRNPTSTRSGGVVNSILAPIISNLDGERVDNPATPVDETKGIVENFYKRLINHPFYKTTLNLIIVLAFSFYGMGFLMGINQFKNSEIVKILIKVGFIYLFTSTTLGWIWFNKFFVGFFKNAVDYITFSVAETFDSANSSEIMSKIIVADYYDKGILFKSVDKVVDLILSAVVQKKILALLFSSIFGWIYFLILYHCLLTYVYAIANAMLLYITCQIIVSVLFVLGPIFFMFLMFKITKDMFDNWIKALIGFSLQQIFLIMTLSLFNTFVIAFLKLSLGYKICWSNILSLNLLYSKISLLNFWIVAGTNAPEAGIEDAPEDSFGSDSNMPSLYLFLFLFTTVTLMKKFIELFTNLAVTLSGGLKASSIASETVSAVNGLAKQIGSKVSNAYGATIGRVVSNIDNFLFDSGSIAEARRAEERKNFASDMKTRASLMRHGNDAVSKYKKEHALELSKMSSSEQKAALESVRDKAMSQYANENGISQKKLDQLKNSSGLNYTGTNLFGALAQAGNQAIFSGGALFNPIADKKISASFSKSEANAALKKMNENERKEFIDNVKGGNIKVNKGKIEIARKVAISAVPRIVSVVLNPKATAQSALKFVASPVSKAISANTKKVEIKKEVISELEKSGKISTINSMAPKFLKNWARSDEDKKIIRDKVRELYRDREKSVEKIHGKKTSYSVIKDLETTDKYIKDTEKNTGQKYSPESLKSARAKVNRFFNRAGNALSRPAYFRPDDPKNNKEDQRAKEQQEAKEAREKIEEKKAMELKSQNNLKEKDKNLSEEIKKKHPDFYYLDKMKDSLKENEKELIKNRKGFFKFLGKYLYTNKNPNKIDQALKVEIQTKGSDKIKEVLEKIDGKEKTQTIFKLAKIDKLIEKELDKKGSDLTTLLDQRREARASVIEKDLNLKTFDQKIKDLGNSDKARKIKEICENRIDKYNENRFSNDIISAVKKIPNIVKILPRLLNSTEESLEKAYRSIKNSPKIKPLANSYSYIKGYIVRSSPKISDQDKQNNPNYKSAYAPVDKLVPTTQILNKRFEKLQIIQDAKVARKALKLLKKVKSPKDMERFVKKYQGLISEKDDEKKS